MVSGWGMTETSPICLMTPMGKTVPGSCGIAVPNTEVKIIDLDTGKSLPPNKRGELCIRGPQVKHDFIEGDLDKHFVYNDFLKIGHAWLS